MSESVAVGRRKPYHLISYRLRLVSTNSVNKLINSIFYTGLLMNKLTLAIPIGFMLVIGAVATTGLSMLSHNWQTIKVGLFLALKTEPTASPNGKSMAHGPLLA